MISKPSGTLSECPTTLVERLRSTLRRQEDLFRRMSATGVLRQVERREGKRHPTYGRIYPVGKGRV